MHVRYLLALLLLITTPRYVQAGDFLVVNDFNWGRTLLYSYPLTDGMSASVVLGQPDMVTSNTVDNRKGIVTASSEDAPDAVTFSGGGLWVSDGGYNRLLEYSGALHSGMAAQTVLGQSRFTQGSPSSRLTAKSLTGPGGIAFDAASGTLFIADPSGSRVLGFLPAHPPDLFANGQKAAVVLGRRNFRSDIPYGVCGGIHCAPACWGRASRGFYSGNASAHTNATSMCNPTQLAFDSDGHLWVVDQGNSRVLRFSPPFANGKAADLVVGQEDMNHNQCATTAYGLCIPEDLKFDTNGNLWVTDWMNSRVLEYVPPFYTGMPATVALGVPDFATSYTGYTAGFPSCRENTLTQTAMCDPINLAFDTAGNLLVSDFDQNRVLAFAPPFRNGGQSAFLVIGEPDFVTNTGCGRPSATSFCNPTGITIKPGSN
jgi:sugar lactone lactonase YvrE